MMRPIACQIKYYSGPCYYLFHSSYSCN